MGKELDFYRIEEKEDFYQKVIFVEFDDKKYAIRISRHSGEKMIPEKDTREILRLMQYITTEMGDIEELIKGEKQ